MGATSDTIPAPTDGSAPLAGHLIDGRYLLLSLIGEGGMGHVYRANHVLMDKPVAVKLIHEELAHIEEVARRFEREARSSSRLTNPHCITVTDFGRTDDGHLFLVMELLEGIELDQKIETSGRIPVDQAVKITCQILKGLAHAHEQGVVHRDLKPENVYLVTHGDEEDFVKILDFGIAKLASDASSENLTRSGVVFGTPRYLSPEQALGDSVDHRADLYAVGIILFEMLVGRPPYEGDTAMDTMSMHLTAPIPRLTKFGSFPRGLGEVIFRAMAKKPNDRYASAEDFLNALESIDLGDMTPQSDTLINIPTVMARLPHGPLKVLSRIAETIPPVLLASEQARMIAAGSLVLFAALLIVLITVAAGSDEQSPIPLVADTTVIPIDAADRVGDIGKNTKKVKAFLNLAEEQIQNGAPSDAVITIKRALSLDPSIPSARLLLGHARFLSGERELAMEEYEDAIAKEPELAKDLRLLENLKAGLEWQPSRAKAALLLATHGEEEDLKLLSDLCNSALTNGEVRRVARQALQDSGHADQIDWLTTLTADFNEDDRCKSRKALIAQMEATGDPRFIPLLEEYKPRPATKGKKGRKKVPTSCISKDVLRALETLQNPPSDDTEEPSGEQTP